MTALNAYVLIAANEPLVAALIEQVVNQMGFTAVVVSDGSKAVQLARTLDRNPTCLIFDVMLPVMGGIDAATAIRVFAPNVHTILMSGSGHGTLFQHGITKSHFAFMEKPFALVHLRSLLGQALQEKEFGA